MYKIYLISKDWKVIQSLKVNTTPKEGEYVYVRGDKDMYFRVITVIHDNIPSPNIIMRLFGFKTTRVMLIVEKQENN
jgi:hypothetical protein